MLTKEELLARARQPSVEALRLHQAYHGKIQVVPKCPVGRLEDFSIWYTPGVAEACKAIQSNPMLAYEYTNRANTIAIVSDGTRVLGLGDIGPEVRAITYHRRGSFAGSPAQTILESCWNGPVGQC